MLMLRREMVVEGVKPIKILSIFCWDVWSVKTFVARCCVELIVERQVASSWQYAAHVLRWLSGHRWRQLYLASASTTSANHCTDEPGFSDTFWLHINVSHFESHRNKERLWVWHSCKVLHSFWQFLAGVRLSVDTNFYRINVICVEDDRDVSILCAECERGLMLFSGFIRL